MHTLKRIIGIASALTICGLTTGCSIYNSPYYKDHSTTWKTKPIAESDKLKAGYLARQLMSNDDVVQFEAQVKAKASNKEFFNAPLATGIAASTLITKNPVTVQGMNTSAGVSVGLAVASAFLPDGSQNMVSAIYLPEQFKGRTLETDEQATTAFWEHVQDRINGAAEQTNRQASCVYGCDKTSRRIFVLTRKQSTGRYLVDPERVLVAVNLPRGIHWWTGDETTTAVLGFKPFRWTGTIKNDFSIEIAEERQKPEGAKDPAPWLSLDDLRVTRLGKDFLRAFFEDGHGFYGMNSAYGRFVTFNGKTYEFKSARSNEFLISEETGEILQ